MGDWGNAAKGAAGGAAAGAVLGPWGAAAGGVIGGALGYFSGGSDKPNVDVNMPNYGMATSQLARMAGGAQNRYAPMTGYAQLNTGNIDQSRAGMLSTANRLGAIASGQQAGAGELAVNRQVGQATAAQTAAARMAYGANSALAYRNAARNTADLGLAGAGQAAQAQMQDQQAANGQLGQLYGQMYGMDTTVADRNAQLQQQSMLANQSARLTQQQMNDAYQIQAMGQLLGWDQATVNARLAKAGLPVGPSVGNSLLQAGGQVLAGYAARPPSQPPPTGGGGGTFNGGDDLMPLSMSDVRNKTNISDGVPTADRVLASVKPYVFSYRDPGAYGAGPQLGVMAQDLERAGLGQAVVDTPRGKAVDPAKLTTANTAMLASLAQRTAQLEQAAALAHNADLARVNAARDEMLRSMGYGRPAPVPVVMPRDASTGLPLGARAVPGVSSLGAQAAGIPPGARAGYVVEPGIPWADSGNYGNADLGGQ